MATGFCWCGGSAELELAAVDGTVDHAHDGGLHDAGELLLGGVLEGVLDGPDLLLVGLGAANRHELHHGVHDAQNVEGRTAGHHVDELFDRTVGRVGDGLY